MTKTSGFFCLARARLFAANSRRLIRGPFCLARGAALVNGRNPLQRQANWRHLLERSLFVVRCRLIQFGFGDLDFRFLLVLLNLL